MRVPPVQRIQRGGVDRSRVDDASDAIRLAGATAIKRDPSVLLADEMEHREIRGASPEDERSGLIQHHRRDETENWCESVELRALSQLVAIEIRAEQRRVNVCDVDEENDR